MIDVAIRIVDRLIALVQANNEQRRAAFESLVQPTMVDLELIHGDYLEMFEGVRRDLREAAGPSTANQALRDAADRLGAARLQNEPLRRKLRQLSEVLRSSDSLPAAPFASTCCAYLVSGTEEGTLSSVVLRALHAGAGSADAIALRDRLLPRMLQNLREAWNDVCKAYAEAKLHSQPR